MIVEELRAVVEPNISIHLSQLQLSHVPESLWIPFPIRFRKVTVSM